MISVNKPGYTFDGWYTEKTAGTKIDSTTRVTITENQTLYPHFTIKNYKVMFDANGGTTNVSEKEVTYDSVYGELPMVTRIGYTFDGWYTDKTSGTKIESTTKVTITSDQTLYAHWRVNIYDISFDANGGTTNISEKEVTYNSTYGDLPTATKTGYTFEGWYTEKTAGTKIESTTSMTVASNHTLYAHYTANTYNIAFDANTGIVSDTEKEVTYDSAYGELPIPTKEGHTFIGWYTEKTAGTKIESTTKVNITSAQTLYAQYVANTYNVTFDFNSDIEETLSKQVTYGLTYGELTVPSRENYTFEGWFTEKTGGTKVESTTKVTITSDQTLYAHWAMLNNLFIYGNSQQGVISANPLQLGDYGTGTNRVSTVNYIEAKPNTLYTSSKLNFRTYFYDSSKTQIGRIDSGTAGKTVTTIDNTAYIRCVWFGTIDTDETITLTEDVSPNNPIEVISLGERGSIDVESSGKNIFNPTQWETSSTDNGVTIQYLEDEDCFTLNGTATKSGGIFVRFINIPAKSSYYSLSSKYVSGTITKTDGQSAVGYFGKNDELNKRANWAAVALTENDSFTTAKTIDTKYITAFWFDISAGVEFDDYKVKIQLEEGKAATSYESYTESVKNTIDLTGHDPLRKIGDIADYIDYENGRIVRNIGKIVFDGTEDWGIESTQNFYTASIISDAMQHQLVLSTHSLSSGYIIITPTANIFISTSQRVNFSTSLVEHTGEAMKRFALDQYNNGTPLTVYYKLAEPTYESIALPNLNEGIVISVLDDQIKGSIKYE